MRTIKFGTCHFVSRLRAIQYYAKQGDDAKQINEKLREGLIAIGPPTVKPGYRLAGINQDGRYEIAEVPPNEGTVKRFEVKVKHDSGYAYLAVYAADMLAAIAFVMESEGCPLGELRSVVDIS